jgi:hypothetical protein
MQVLKTLPWEERSDEALTELFVGKTVVTCTLYQDEESCDSIEAVMEIEGGSVLVSASTEADDSHHVFHAFLSDERGHVVEGFPVGEEISSVCYVKRVEHNREWLCGGHRSSDGCIVMGIQFSFDTGSPGSSRKSYCTVGNNASQCPSAGILKRLRTTNGVFSNCSRRTQKLQSKKISSPSKTWRR